MPPDQARLIASAAYTLARAANADLDISDDETAAIEHELQVDEALDEATAVLVTEMAKLQAKTVGGTEDYVVTREFKALADEQQRLVSCGLLRGRGGQRHDLGRGDSGRSTRSPRSSTSTTRPSTAIRADFHEQFSAVQQVRRIAGGRLTPTGPGPQTEAQLHQAVAEPAADLGQHLRVVGDAAAQLHRQPPPPGPGTWMTTRVAPGRSRMTVLNASMAPTTRSLGALPGEPDVEDRARARRRSGRRPSRRRRCVTRASSGTGGSSSSSAGPIATPGVSG